MRPIAVLLASLVVATIALSLAVVNRLHDSDRRWRDVAGDRLVMGVPWGTMVVVVVLVCVYLFVQDGISDPSDPVTIPFRAWSYFYPLGVASAAFAHASPGHLVGNLAGTVVAAPLAEYAWGHYTDGREPAIPVPSARLRSWWTDPWIRALVIFPLAVVVIGLITSLFALGPVIGFSGVVFAFAAFAIVHYPIVTLVGMLGVQSALGTIYRALQNPINTYTAEPRPPTAPSWAEVAIQGHALGFFIGLVLAIALLEHRGDRPNPLHIWVAVLLYALSRGLWQLYWFGEGETYILFQGPGIVIVALLALVITVAVTASDRSVVPRRLERHLGRDRRADDRQATEHSSALVDRPLEIARGFGDETAAEATTNPGPRAPNDRFDRVRDIASGARARDRTGLASITRRSSAVGVVFVVLAVLAGMAIPVNLVVFDETTASSDAIEIEDYRIQYVEEAENRLVSGVGLDEVLGETGLEATGVVVSSDRRNIWQEVVTEQHLAHTGDETIAVGGPGWRETVTVDRVGWEPVGNEPVYQIRMWEDGSDPAVVYNSDSKLAEARIDNRMITVAADDGEFVLEVESNDTVETTPMPAAGESTTANDLTFEHDRGTISAVSDRTTVAIATEETYNGD